MTELFGLSMTAIMLVLLAAFGVCLAAFGVIYLSNRVMFRMGVRNIGRRRAQSVLVVSGLMLATIIITAAFSTGDSIDYSITNVTYNALQRTDLSLHHFQSPDVAATEGGQFYAHDDLGAKLSEAFKDDPDIEGFVPLLFEPVPAINPRTRLAEPGVIMTGVDVPQLDRFGGLHLTNGDRADLAGLKENQLFANKTAADKMDIRAGDTVNVFVSGKSVPFEVVGIVKDERASGLVEFGPGAETPGFATKMATVQNLTGHVGEINSVSVVLRGGVHGSVDRSEPAAKRLEAFIGTAEGKAQLGLGSSGFQVERIKKDTVDAAELAGNLFTTIFLVLGLFSIASGVLLIFMIFVMLAAERRQEMGITRAVGAEPKHLVQAFLAEGMVYDLIAGVVGIVIGVVAAVVLVVGGTKLFLGGDFGDAIRANITWRSLVISFCLGAVLTFLTVVGSAIYVSRLNIVAAIRGTSDRSKHRARKGVSWRWILGSLPLALVVPPWGLYWLLHRGFGVSRTNTIVPLGSILAALLMWSGKATGSDFLFSSGISLVPVMAALLLRSFGANNRLVWTGVGAALLLYWLMPFSVLERLFGKFESSSGMEMFVLSGIMIVLGLTLIIVFNARILTIIYGGSQHGRRGYGIAAGLFGVALVLLAGGIVLSGKAMGVGEIGFVIAMIAGVAGIFALIAQRFPGLAPALKMAIAYPLANRFRTGMTIAMFSLIIFSLTVMGILNGSFLQLFAGDEARGSWDIYVSTNVNNPVDDLTAALQEEGSFDTSQIAAIGRVTPRDDDRQRARMAGTNDEWVREVVGTGDATFWDQMEGKLEYRAYGYDSDRAIYDAVRDGQNLAIIDYNAFVAAQGFGPETLQASGVKVTDDRFAPFEVEVRNEATQQVERVTVIGAWSSRIPTGLLPQLMTSPAFEAKLFGKPDFRDMFVRLEPGVSSDKAAKGIKAALVTQGVQTLDIKKAIDDAMAMSTGLLRLMQVFMALGLFVGIAAIGVISLRSVVERRQQIGMLRALGYEKHTVAASFLFETAFVSLMGIGSGVLGAVMLSRNLVTSSSFTGSTTGLDLYVPWAEVILYSVLAFAFSLLMTWWPSRRAASVPIAEALRYE